MIVITMVLESPLSDFVFVAGDVRPTHHQNDCRLYQRRTSNAAADLQSAATVSAEP